VSDSQTAFCCLRWRYGLRARKLILNRLITRFVVTPVSAVDKRLLKETGDLKTDITNLEKKLHYLETTHTKSKENIDQILRAGSRS
jgi:hypothetical protein